METELCIIDFIKMCQVGLNLSIPPFQVAYIFLINAEQMHHTSRSIPFTQM